MALPDLPVREAMEGDGAVGAMGAMGATGAEGVMSEEERLAESEHMINLTVAVLILTIFSFFFIIILAILCLNWLERKRNGFMGQSLLLPTGPVPGYMTVLTSDHPHLRLLGHYRLEPVHPSKQKTHLFTELHYDTPQHLIHYDTDTVREKRMSY
ncbi:uncharacterized protein LOC125025593 [Penaeus chinensis]|uniref:uncharacterized protein LOC125025593 n=1 Tax=Penaeus chinensis TaxID=139456 RepID=UPI001FB6DFB7|nr:uncharacterized protein LOC125025593 [Penaeus chinensis]XP_047469584.1 uncharacterized protein LOC125025593 [Penaeus chinensis]XP_047469591.1 uncharacterized protein LOC125025593 [Penaeus chinensis]XP_047469600.1 uncharacterized protein LOC125025593 [Penaeus chinensis]XP_047469610.1 uncharacterized protein LOC125025593 [Penaeus chinensis]XP_047469618.1 uncharacterized protein LOC125025593 [Penaeus chinensis]XP_047469628.1 uncharacterized protein LOC125025593 [Penaeus chinensis]XP_04746963